MKLLFAGVLFLFSSITAFASDGDYAVSKIPLQLLVEANAVKRIETIRFELSDVDHARYYRKVAFTILNEKGDKFARCLESYDKLHSIENLDGRLFDANGKKIKSVKRSEISDRSGTDEGTLADDSRYKYHNFYYKVYPYTVEYEVEIKYYYTMFYPGWVPVEDDHLSVENGSITVSIPAGMAFRYKSFNFKDQPLVQKERSGSSYSWALTNQPAIISEVYAPSWYEMTPVVCMAPVQFAIQGYKGNMSTWNDYGKFVYALKEGRDQLPENIKKTVHELTDGVKDPREKINVLYNFLQKNSRYISVQLGIGGWQPYDASYVAAKRYGDCKALVNYMYSLLKEAGIKSNYTLVKAGENNPGILSDFPSSQFNHVILSVPMAKDTVWLECTSQDLPAGYLSGFTSDRKVLVVNETGGTLVSTPKYGLKENLQIRKISAELKANGILTADVSTMYKARQEDNLHSMINTLARDKVLEKLKQKINLPNYDVLKFEYLEDKGMVPSITENLTITATDYAQISGKRVFLMPNILSKEVGKLLPDETRKFDIQMKFEYTDEDSVEIRIPEGFSPEAMPRNIVLKSAFGDYTNSYKLEKDKIVYYRRMEQFGGRFPAADYPKLVQFFSEIYKADRARIVLIKQ